MTEDRELIKRTLAGEREAFDEIVARYQDGLYRHLLRLTGRQEEAEDLCQEAFIGLYRALRRFNTERPLVPFLFTIATNAWKKRLRDAGPEVPMLCESAEGGGDPVSEKVLSRLEYQRILAALMRLQPEQREAVSLFYDQGLSYREISGITGAPIGTVSARLKRGLDTLRRALAAGGAGLVIPAGVGDLPQHLTSVLQGQAIAPSSIGPVVAHGISTLAPAGAGVLTLWKGALVMNKAIYVAVGLAVAGGAVVGVPRLMKRADRSQPLPQVRSTNLENVKAEADKRAAGMQQNYEAIRNLVAEVVYEQQKGPPPERLPGGGLIDSSSTRKFIMKCVDPKHIYFEEIEKGNSLPLAQRWTDGKEVRTLVKLVQPPGERKNILYAGRIKQATGTPTDWGEFSGINPLSAIYGSGPVFVTWQALQSKGVVIGPILQAGREKQFGVQGYGFIFDRGVKNGRNLGQLYYWVDDTHGFMPRIISFRGGESSMEMRITEVAKAGQAWIPTRMTRNSESEDGGAIDGEMRVLSFHIDPKITPEAIELRFASGTVVKDESAGRSYTVGEK